MLFTLSYAADAVTMLDDGLKVGSARDCSLTKTKYFKRLSFFFQDYLADAAEADVAALSFQVVS